MSSYLDGELSGSDMMVMRRHVENCLTCRAHYESESAAKRLLSALPEREVSPGLDVRIMEAIRKTTGVESPAQATLWPTGKMAFALAAAAVAMFCVFLMRGNDSVGQPVSGNEIAYDQDWNNARSVFPANNLPAGLNRP
jgi:anti-sigma factor RsiW